MKKILFLWIAFLMGSCITPINLNFETAELLNTGEFEAQVAGSIYGSTNAVSNYNLGLKLGYGFSEKFNLKLRYELSNQPLFEESFNTHYIELDHKFRFTDWMSGSVAVGNYSREQILAENIMGVVPRVYISPLQKEHFDMTVILKTHLIFGTDVPYAFVYADDNFVSIPGISLGMGFSSDFERWSVRPEIGYDGYTSAGIAFSYKFGNNNRSEQVE